MQRGFSPLDRLMLVYLLGISMVVVAFHHKIAHTTALLLLHSAGIGLIAAYAWLPLLPGAYFIRNWYPLLYIGVSYRVVAVLVPSLWPAPLDPLLAGWDYTFWGVHPTVWLERLHSPLLTELLQLLYTLFAPSVVFLAVILWTRGDKREFRSYAFLITLGFLVSYVAYLAVPARGPRFYLAHLQTKPLVGLLTFHPLAALLDTLESVHYDCFPSGHVEMSLLAWWAARRMAPGLAPFYAAYFLATLLATVYLRYHYTVDLLAGIAVAAAVLAWAPQLEKTLGR